MVWLGMQRAMGTLLVVTLAASACEAAVHPYNNDFFYSVGDSFIFRGGREGMFASKSEAVTEWGTVAPGVANGKSYIRFSKVVLERPKSVAREFGPSAGDTGLVQAVVFEVKDRERIGYAANDGYQRSYCCTQELVPKTQCTPGHVIIQPHAGKDNWPWQTNIFFTDNDTLAFAVEDAVTIEETGMYYLWFVICDPNLAGVTISGQTSWKNPNGYLPGMMAPNLPFFGVMSLAYMGLGALWFLAYLRHWIEILPLQNCITAVLALGMIEMSTWYFDYVNFNTTGYRPYVTTLWAVLLGSIRKTLSRMLILVVSMGFGVVRPTLGGITRKVLALGLGYFAGASALDVLTNVGTIDDLTSEARVFLVLPVAVLDAVFILWIFTSLSKTLSQLQARRQTAKLEVYRRFTNTLAVAVVVSIAWIAYEMYFKVSDQFNERWESDWITNAFWHALTFCINAVICFLWAPTGNSTRYAYSEDVPDEEGADEEAQPLRQETSRAGGGEVDTNVFSIDDDDDGEESKMA